MWPDVFQNWYDIYADDASLFVRSRLASYPILKPFSGLTADAALARSYEIGSYLCKYDNYFSNLDFRRWLMVVCYREALRLILPLERVEFTLQPLKDLQKRLLHWCYIDQLTLNEVARMLTLESRGRDFFNLEEAKSRVLTAYNELSATIAGNSLDRQPKVDRDLQHERVFPKPPCLTCACGRKR